MSETFHQPFYITGQTGSGKTGVAIALAQRLCRSRSETWVDGILRMGGAEIINADAFQVYQGIEILSAAPHENEKKAVPHHLLGIFPLSEECDSAKFAALARKKINEVSLTAIPIVVGGSGLYLKSITHGLAPTPRGNSDLRNQLELRSLEDLVAEYQRLDPVGAATTNLKNRRYVTRNLEICLLSGEPASNLKSSWENQAPDVSGVYLQRPREEIYERINQRTCSMFDQGVVEEIRRLKVEPSLTAVKSIGLREIQALISGEITEEEAVVAIQQITRRYAKRQETWFKKEPIYQQIPCRLNDSAETIVDRILEIFPIAKLQARQDHQPCPSGN